MSNYTQEPWNPSIDKGYCVKDKHGRMVAHCHTFDQTDAQREANARLIAAAPELLAALQEAKRIAQEPDKFKSLQERESAIIAWKKQARAAIEKAKV